MKVSNQCKEVIIGSFLGDGSIINPHKKKRARFEFRHSIIQKEYFFWKVRQLKAISGPKCFRVQTADGWSLNDKLHYGSKHEEFLAEIYRLTHPNGKFSVNNRWLKLLSPLSLLVWWLDDGSLTVNSRKGVFCTEGYSRRNIQKLSQYLKSKWNIKTHIGRRGKYHQLRFYSTEELKKFLRIILPHLRVRSMLHKFTLLYKDSQLQQRWISEICKLTGFSRKMVNCCTEQKRTRWKKFRE